ARQALRATVAHHAAVDARHLLPVRAVGAAVQGREAAAVVAALQVAVRADVVSHVARLTLAGGRDAAEGAKRLRPEEVPAQRADAAGGQRGVALLPPREAEVAAPALGAAQIGTQAGWRGVDEARAPGVADLELVRAEALVLVDVAGGRVAAHGQRVLVAAELGRRAGRAFGQEPGAIWRAHLDLGAV